VTALLSASDVHVSFPAGRRRRVQAVSGVGFDVAEGETLGIVGESGCGKSTLGRAVLQMPRPDRGSVRFEGVELTELRGEALRQVRPRLQMVFQDPVSTLNPNRRVHEIVAEGPRAWGRTVERSAVESALADVGLEPEVVWDRRPAELSGGQCQRVNIARALVLEPRLVVCDEPVSALDVSVQAQVLNLIRETRERLGLSLVFIAHDLAVVKNISDRIMVLYLGKVCEVAPADELCDRPAHPYTALLLASVLDVDGPAGAAGSTAAEALDDPAELPSPLDPPSGCRFRTRCPRADARCADEEPVATEVGDGHTVACHHPLV
jgi:peptide/nickel transport system ATP-binding protein